MTGERPLDGKVALVTGAGRRRGIGYGIARHLAGLGASVAIVGAGSRSTADSQYAAEALGELHAMGDELAAMGHGRHLAAQADVSNPEQVGRLLDRIGSELGVVEILVNNAGVCPVKPLLETTFSEWEKTMGVNASGAFLCSTEAARRMIAHGIRGNIVSIASLSAKEGWPDFGAYTASKFALLGFTEVFAREMAPHGIRVNAVCPGYIAAGVSGEITNTFAAKLGVSPEELDRNTVARVPLGRYGTAEDVAQTVAFLVSPAASYITGQAINVCGGVMVSH